MYSCCAVLLLAFAVDFIIGDPHYGLHPTRLIGRLISFLQKPMENRGLFNEKYGVILTISVLSVVFCIYFAAVYTVSFLGRGFETVFYVFVLYSSLALKDMFDHTNKIYFALKSNDLEKAKRYAGMIVGRDTQSLNESGIVMAAVESMSENFVDGFASVVFWYFIGAFAGCTVNFEPTDSGVLFALLYRSVNTLDSMVGYKNAKYIRFGRFAARLDDAVNFIPARISVFFICLSAYFVNEDSLSCFKTAKKDRLKHPSPNSAHAESAVAGAMKIKLGGTVIYPYLKVEKPFIGETYKFPEKEHIKRCKVLLTFSAVIFVVFSEILCCLLKNPFSLF